MYLPAKYAICSVIHTLQNSNNIHNCVLVLYSVTVPRSHTNHDMFGFLKFITRSFADVSHQGFISVKGKYFFDFTFTWVIKKCLNLISMPYPCSHFYFDINFGDRLYSKEKRRAWPLLFRT